MTKSIEETNYESLSQKPENWLQQAKWLKISAEAILSGFNEAAHSRNPSERREKQLAFFQSHLMLRELSFENLIKGVHIAETPELSAEERLKCWKSHRGGHGLVSLAKEVTHLSAEEENLLKRLEIYSVWAGRYPTSTKVREFVESYTPENLHTFSTDDEHLCDALFSRLSTLLQNELIRQSTTDNKTMHLTAIIQRDELSDGTEMFLATCPELDVVSQGETSDAARANLQEAVEGLLQIADDAEIGRRLRHGASVESLKVAA